MPVRKVILARHGQTELNRVGIIQGSGVDPSLNAEGNQQAAELFAALTGTIDLVGSSGMLRAKETAQPFAEAGVPYFEDYGFREISWGEYEGKAAQADMRVRYSELLQNWEQGKLDDRIKGGESAAELAARLQSSWLALLEKDFSSALVVLHGRALRCLSCWLNGDPVSMMNNYAHANCGYYSIEIDEKGTWTVTEQNVTAHLTKTEIFHR
ncbi:MAG: histidine phosphatase family protein [Saprospiraceae bacterium]